MSILNICLRGRGTEIKKWKETEDCHNQVLYGDDTDVNEEAQKFLMYTNGDYTRV